MLIFFAALSLWIIAMAVLMMVKGKGILARLFGYGHMRQNPDRFDLNGYFRFAGFCTIVLAVVLFLWFVGGFYEMRCMLVSGSVLALILMIFIMCMGGASRYMK